MDKRTAFDIVNKPSPLEGKEEHKIEYIKEMLSLAKWSQKHVMLYITASLGTVFFFLAQIGLPSIRALPLFARILSFVAVLFEVIGAWACFLYIRALHITQMKMTRCIVSLDVNRVRELWAGEAGVYQRNRIRYRGGRILMLIGMICLAAILFLILFGRSFPGPAD